MRNFILLFVFFSLGIFSGNAQVFSWKNPNVPEDSIKRDSILAARLEQDIFAKDTLDFIRTNNKIVIDEAVLAKNDKKRFLGELNSKGSIIRGITFGNNQGQSVQSSMDLQISGRLSKDVTILASISDHNLPIQADGYTQTLEEFDKIYIQLNIKDKSILRAGHLDLVEAKNYFAKYQRRSMGIQFQTELGKENKTFIDVSAGVARSEFHRVRFQGVEGNQGPYRLTGKNGEQFITLISGSEQVFIDGILMKRGENQDYIINYNTGEVTFTSFRPIFQQNFITISYNYANRNYSRYLFTGKLEHQREKFKVGLNWFMENDNKNAPLSLNLSKEDEQILADAGNDPNLMYAPSGVLTEYDVNKILYRKNAAGNYEFSTDQNEPLYQVSFTYFGVNQGDYKTAQTTNNGRVFEYVGPNAGDYRAVRKLPSPQKSQVFSLNSEYLLNEGKIGADISLSNYDVNLFSSKDSDQNIGYAYRIFGNKSFTKNNWKGTPSFEYQYIDRQFHILDRINDVEFSRDFNLAQEFNKKTQNRFIFSFLNKWNNKSTLNYRINYLNEQDSYKGIKNDLDFGWISGKFFTKGTLSYLSTNATLQDTKFIRGGVSTEYTGKKGSWTIGGSMEHNEKKYNDSQLMDVTSFSWKELFVQKKIGDSTRTKLLAKVYMRDNDSVRDNRLQNMNNILGVMAESQIIKNERTSLNVLIHYRKFFYQNVDPNVTTRNNDFVVGNILYNQQLFRNGMRLQAFYELGNGQEAQREFQYIKVTDGQGIYKWTDYNGDGIQQLDEFEIAEYSDLAKYIRVYTNSVRYIPSNKNKLQLALFVNPAIVFNSENKFLKRWNFNVSLNSQNSFYKKDKVLVLNPFEKNSDQILKNQNILASVQFNPTDKSGWNGNYRFITNDNLINANFSNEERQQTSQFVNIGYWFNKEFRVDWENSVHDIKNSSQQFTTRDYRLNNFETKPKATYKFTDAIQAELSSAYRQKKRLDGEELLKAFDVTGTIQWERKKTSIRGNFSFINNNFNGNNFSIVGNQMLDGLKPGKNQVWSVFIQQAINSFIQLNLNYEGRNSGDRTIHIGSMQVKASF
ncbi:hypothetical protein CRN76_14300 [Chryseobacterium indologenes]|uniref:Uncharacterized protein n=1 Tax=Chryseobacterium indologenes TaxID=253 RepID=A0AAD0YVT7_CHRID|nr:hypothetical protein [Chryseobacterium indologenes]ASE62674.1 hypothetical protein CEQ15_14780 [Chryseobacterium indologenes]ATN06492.1 hypothetical protein CRN76_14300 [Chryseobacterium indologenes]AYY84747.1 hypothetical protein EGX91_09425 [Chryseobacterium indologenes]AZB18368.1 hypothetical protein EG352_11545 [Chryseobacterium indologenes]